MLNKALSLTLLVSLSSACGLIKVNGKPLGGGSSSPSPEPSEASPSPQPSYVSSSPEHDDEAPQNATPEERAEWRKGYHARRAERERKQAAEQARLVAESRKGQPGWCQEYRISESVDIDLSKFKNLESTTYDESDNKHYFAAFMCSTRGKHRELKPKVLELRAKWMKAQGIDEQDFVAMVADVGWDGKKYESFPGPVSQMESADAITLDRLGPQASMLARFSYADTCTDMGRGGNNSLLAKISCASESLDRAKAFAEIDATAGMTPGVRLELRKLVRRTVQDHDKLRAEIAALAKDEPGIAQLVAIAGAQRKEWASPSAERTKLAEQLSAMEDATTADKRSGFAGCEATTYASWAAAVKGAAFSKVTFETAARVVMPAVFRDAESYLAFKALVLCAKGSGVAVPMEGDVPAMVRRGPRTATMAAWIAAADSIKFDNKKFDGVVPAASFYNGGRILDGTIAKISPDGDRLTISFKPELYKRDECVASKKTGKIGYYTDGRPYAEEVCTKRAMVTNDSSPDDISVPAFWAKGLKPGMFLFVGKDWGTPIAALNARDGTGVWALGAPLK